MRRKEAGIPEEITFKTKTELALDLIDEVRGWGLQDRLVLADSAYGDTYEFRQGLRDRKLDYVVQVSGDLTAWTEDPHPSEPPMKRGGKIPRKRFYAKDFPPARSLCQIAKDLPSRSWKTITWREGTKGPLYFSFCSGDRLDGQWIGARKDDEGATGRVVDRVAGGGQRTLEVLAFQFASSADFFQRVGPKGQRTFPC